MSPSLPSLMSPLAILFLALSMSMDAFAVSVGRGTALVRPQLPEALRTGLVFGIVEGLMPLFGWLLGLAASGFVAAVDHWIAFGLLSVVGLRMAWSAWRGESEEIPAGTSLPALAAMAVGTSLDSMAVGVSLAFLKVNIFVVALSIGFSTFVMSSGGLMLGRMIGEKWGRAAAVAAGLFLFGLGGFILWQGLMVG